MTIIAEAHNDSYKVEIHSDDDASSVNPRTDTNVGTFIVWAGLYTSPDDREGYHDLTEFLAVWNDSWVVVDRDGDAESDGYTTEEEAQAAIPGAGGTFAPYTIVKKDGIGKGGVMLAVEVFDSTYSMEEFNPERQHRYDGVIYVTADKIKEEWGSSTDPIAKATHYLTTEVDYYSQWASGNVYGFICYEKASTHTVITHANGSVTESDGIAWEQMEDGAVWGFIGDPKTSGMVTSIPDECRDLFEQVAW